MGFDRGYISGYFVTNQERMEVSLDNAYILLTDKRITLVKQDLLPTLELISKTNQPLVIISDNYKMEKSSKNLGSTDRFWPIIF